MKSFNEIMKIRDEPESKETPVEKKKFQIKKSDDEKMQAFGWANISITAANWASSRRAPA